MIFLVYVITYLGIVIAHSPIVSWLNLRNHYLSFQLINYLKVSKDTYLQTQNNHIRLFLGLPSSQPRIP